MDITYSFIKLLTKMRKLILNAMKIKGLMLYSILIAIIFPSCSEKEKSAVSKEKLNVLFIWTDEQSANTMRAYGNNVIQTPNLDRLAETSTVFLNTYVSQPVCTPSRSSVMTGLYPPAAARLHRPAGARLYLVPLLEQ